MTKTLIFVESSGFEKKKEQYKKAGKKSTEYNIKTKISFAGNTLAPCNSLFTLSSSKLVYDVPLTIWMYIQCYKMFVF